MNKKIAMLGSGAFGTAISMLLADNHHDVAIWCHEPQVADDITKIFMNNRYLPGVKLSPKITATTNLKEVLHGADIIFQATPVKYLRMLFSYAHDVIPDVKYRQWVLLSKGLEQHSLLFPSQILQDIFGKSVHYAVVGGPNFAIEIAQKKLSVTTVAGPDDIFNNTVRLLLSNNYFKAHTSHDPLGVQVGGAFKNIIALAAGIASGAGYKENTRAAVITQGMHEIAMLAQYFGGKQETVYGMSGLGDLILTCGSELSKNFHAGKMIGKGMPLGTLAEQMPVLPEGINTVQSLHSLISQQHLVLPLCRATFDCIFQGESAAEMLGDIFG